jgi:hypothetical protein
MNPTKEQAAHCESGVAVELLRASGLEISEPLVFGIGSGLFFAHMPFLKVTGFPITSFRSIPGTIFRKTCQRLGVRQKQKKFLFRKRMVRAEKSLDTLLSQGVAVGLRTNIQWLNYFPKQFRFNFNGHHIIVKGKSDKVYQILDPVVDTPVTCHRDLLERARFASGPLAPNGLMFFLQEQNLANSRLDLPGACLAGLRETIHRMLYVPLPIFGVNGISLMARRFQRMNSKKVDEGLLCDELAFVVRMQEEIGTGGAGFRYLFGAFLQEAAFVTNKPELKSHSQTITQIGDVWREFAYAVSLLCKGKRSLGESAVHVNKHLNEVFVREKELFQDLRKVVYN